MNRMDVIGCCGMNCSAAGRAALGEAEIVAASERLLRIDGIPAAAEKTVLAGTLLNALPGLIRRSENRRVAVLASGDPLYCGIGATLRRFAAPEQFRFFPAPTAFQQLFAALGQPWENAALFSLHARGAALPYRRMLCSELCAVYGDARRPAREIARELIEKFPAAALRPAAAGCSLGLPDEAVVSGTLAQIAASEAAAASLSVLALLPWDGPSPEFPPGLPDAGFAHHKNMITHPELRAIVLAKLRLRRGVMWDLGAGSGSVGLEAALLAPELTVFAVERDAERFAQLQANCEAENPGNLRPFHGDGIARMAELPDPERIFIGGGGKKLLSPAFDRLKPGGILVMTAVMLDTVAMMAAFRPELRMELLTVNISRAADIGPAGFQWKAENPITVGVWRKVAEEPR